MSFKHAYQIMGHWGQLLYGFIESDYGSLIMGIFVASYGCDRAAWASYIQELKNQLNWLKLFFPALLPWCPWLQVPTEHWIKIMETIIPLYATIEPRLPEYPKPTPEEPEEPYPPLPADPAQWFS